MAGQFQVTEDELNVLSGKIDTVRGQLQGEISRLNGVIDQIAAGWKGDAANAYHQLQNRWNEDARKMNDILSQIGEAVDSTRSSYVSSEDDQKSAVSSIMSDFG